MLKYVILVFLSVLVYMCSISGDAGLMIISTTVTFSFWLAVFMEMHREEKKLTQDGYYKLVYYIEERIVKIDEK